jgi:Zn-dependent protease
MLFSSLDDFVDNPLAFVAYLAAFAVAMITGLVFHEFCHAWSAYQLGDPTAANRGRLTLNPLRHLDPLGTVLLFVVGIGWAKPTPVNTHRLRHGALRGGAIVSFAGPLSNFFIASVAALPIKAGLIDSVADLNAVADASGEEIIGLFLVFLIIFNVLLGVFNLIPIPPLDGFSVLQVALPESVRLQLEPLKQYGPIILMVLLVISLATNGAINPLGSLIGGAIDVVFPLIT